MLISTAGGPKVQNQFSASRSFSRMVLSPPLDNCRNDVANVLVDQVEQHMIFKEELPKRSKSNCTMLPGAVDFGPGTCQGLQTLATALTSC